MIPRLNKKPILPAYSLYKRLSKIYSITDSGNKCRQVNPFFRYNRILAELIPHSGEGKCNTEVPSFTMESGISN
jgi:hypothetical protein